MLKYLAQAAAGELRATVRRETIAAALSEHARAERQQEQRVRLGNGLSVPLIDLPFLFADHLGIPELERLADALGDSL